MNELTLTKMKQMKLYGMHGAFKTAVETGKTDHYSIDQFVSMIIDAEWDERHNRRIERIIKNANTYVNDNFWSSNSSDTAIKSVSGNVAVNPGDTISVWLQSTAGNNNMVQNFKLLSGALYYESVTMDG